MTKDFIVNKAGAKIYEDINKHEFLDIPVLSNENDEGAVYSVLSVGIVGPQREPIVTIKEFNGKVVAYRLPYDLSGWVQNSLLMSMDGINLFPGEVEFGELNGRVYAEIL